VLGEKNAGLAFAYCDKAYDGMVDASAAQTVKLFGATHRD
jgi:hypothetical protein